jgi:hypothetical protein
MQLSVKIPQASLLPAYLALLFPSVTTPSNRSKQKRNFSALSLSISLYRPFLFTNSLKRNLGAMPKRERA